MNEKSPLLLKYERMLLGESGGWFDEDEFYEIAFEYETSSLYSEALRAVEIGLKYHPMSDELLTRCAYYNLILGDIEASKEAISKVMEVDEDVLFIKSELYLIENKINKALPLVNQLLSFDKLAIELYLDIAELCARYKIADEIFPTLLDEALNKLAEIDRIPALREISEILFENNLYDWAIKVIEKLIDENPYSAQDWNKLASCQLALDDYEKAMDSVEFALAIDPENHFYKMTKAMCHFGYDNYIEAIDLLEQIKDCEEERILILLSICYSRISNYSKSDAMLKEAETRYGESAYRLYLAAKNVYDHRRDIPSAIDLLVRAREYDDIDTDIAYMLAELYFQIEKYDEAYQVLKSIFFVDSDNAKLYSLMGDVELKMRRYGDALNSYRAALDISPKDIDLILKIAYTYSETGDIAHLQRTLVEIENIISEESEEGLSEEDMEYNAKVRDTVAKLKDILNRHIDEI